VTVPKWHDKVPSEKKILQTAARLTDQDDCYVVHKFRYAAASHRGACKGLCTRKLLKRLRGENPFIYYQITQAGRDYLKTTPPSVKEQGDDA
jgi:hypothetical protein